MAYTPALIAAAVLTSAAAGQSSPPASGTEEPAWSFSIAATAYIVSEGDDYLQPTVMADHDWLHLEARYNYESMDTGSIWIGYNFGGTAGETFSWDFTPMIGGVFGDVTGVAPGFELTLTWEPKSGEGSWGAIELYSEGEYVFDTDESDDSFFYSWSSLTVAPEAFGGFRLGIVGQRTRAYDSDRDLQYGPLVGYSSETVSLSAYVLNLDDDPVYAVSCVLSF